MSLDSSGNDAKMVCRGNISLTDLFNLYPESPCVVVVKNISDITSRDTLENYLARILDVDVKEVHYPANVNGCCIAVFYRPIRGLWKFRKALGEQPLDGHVLNLSPLGRCDGLLIRNPPSNVCTAVLETFKKSGESGEFTGVTEEAVKDIEYLNCDTGRFAVVHIPDTAVISKFLNIYEQSKCQIQDFEIYPYFPNLHDLLREHRSHVMPCLETDVETVCDQVGRANTADGVVMRKPVKPSKNEVPKYRAKVQASDDTRRPRSKPVLRDPPPKETGLSQSAKSSASNAVKNQRPGFPSNGHTCMTDSDCTEQPEFTIERLRLQKLEQEETDEALAKSVAAQEQQMLLYDSNKSETDQFRKHRPQSKAAKDRDHRTTTTAEQGTKPTLWYNVGISTSDENPMSWSLGLNLDIVQVARGISSKEKKSTKRCTEEELLAPNSDSMQETETFFQPLEKHENISDEARKKIKKILKKNHVKSNRTSGSKTFMLEGDKESVKKAYEEIIQLLFTDDTEGEVGTNPSGTTLGQFRDTRNWPSDVPTNTNTDTAARKDVVEYMALKDDPKVPRYWKHFNPGSLLTDALQTIEQKLQLFTKDYIRVELKSNDPEFKAIEKLIKSTWDKGKAGDDLFVLGLLDLDTTEYRGVRIKTIHRIENLQLYEKYSRHRKRTFLKIHREGRKCCNSVEEIPKSRGPVMTRGLTGCQVLCDELFPEINEYFLFHGTSRDVIDAICNTGLDFRVGSQHSMYGHGVYTAESPSKANEFVDPLGERDRQMFLVRMILGDSYLNTNLISQKFRRPPCANMKHLRDDCTIYSHGSFDSVIGQSRTFREFVVYEKDQSYPEYLITYSTK